MKKDDWRFVYLELFGTIAGMLLAMCMLGLLASCRVQKEVTEEQTINHQLTEFVDGFNVAEYLLNNTAITWSKDTINTSTHIYVRVYDTSLPKDSGSGFHPLLQEIDITTDKVEIKDTEMINQSKEEKKDSSSVNIEAVLKDSVSQKVRTSTKKGVDRVIGFEWCLLLAGCFAMVVGAIFVYFKKFRR